jgi:epoxyqueuosine reductase
MTYLAREDAVERRLSPPLQFRSAVVVGLNYYTQGEGDGESEAEGEGEVARYARGRDYHKVIKSKLFALLRFVEAEVGHALPLSRAYVDTGPVLERELARRAGLGWYGRNTMLINLKRGSYFFLGALLLELELDYDDAFTADHCGSCNACVEACPTGALLGRDANGAPLMDATRCISYLTIEQRGPIPRELRSLIGNRIFGCDICQEVCPWNAPKFVQLASEKDFAVREQLANRRLIDLMKLGEAEWDEFSRGSSIRRAKRSGFLRNVAVALGNWGSPEAVPVLVAALSDEEPLVRGHAAWALSRIGSPEALEALCAARTLEPDGWVREEVVTALRPHFGTESMPG